MRDEFSGRYRPTDEEFDRLWEEGIFVFDANVLLNLYRYSAKAQQQLMTVLNVLKERTWLPHQAAKEFMERRIEVIHDRRKTYRKLKADLREAFDKAENQVNGLHRDGEIELSEPLEKVQDSIEDLVARVQELEDRVPEVTNSPEEDGVWAAVEQVFEGRVGPHYSPGRVSEIYKEGDERYARGVPPGYKDVRKDNGPGKQPDVGRRFGDLLLWYQVLDKAKEDQRPVILVTDDRKDDWWWNAAGKTIGPRPELVEEVLEKTGVPFYMYRPDRFVEEADRRGLAGEGISLEVIAEMGELGHFEQTHPARKSQLDLLRTLAQETWGELGVGILESKIEKSLDDLTRHEANITIDWLVPDDEADEANAGSAEEALTANPLGYEGLRETGAALSSYVGSLLTDLESSDFERQNKAVRALRNAGHQELADLDYRTQERLGRAVVAAARGVSYWGSFAAQRFVEQLGLATHRRHEWPGAFAEGMLLATLLTQDGRFDPKTQYLQPVVAWAQHHPQAADILSSVSASVRNAEPRVDASDWRQGRGEVNVYAEVVEILNDLPATPEDVREPLDSLIETVKFLKGSNNPEGFED